MAPLSRGSAGGRLGATITRPNRNPPMRLLAPFARSQTYRSLLFLVMAVPVAAVALGLLIAGWTTMAVLAITPLVIPLLVGFRGATGLLARGDAALAQEPARRRRRAADRVGRPLVLGQGQGRARRRVVLEAAGLPRDPHGRRVRGRGRDRGADRRRAPGDRLPDHVPLVVGGHRLVARRHVRVVARLLRGRHRRAARRRAPDRAARPAVRPARHGSARAGRASRGGRRADLALRRAARRSPSTPASRSRSSRS